MTLTPDDIARLEKLCEEATPGPWVNDAPACVGVNHPGGGAATVCITKSWSMASEQDKKDAAFIAAAREAVPELIAALREAKRKLHVYQDNAIYAAGEADDRIKALGAECDRLRARVAELEGNEMSSCQEHHKRLGIDGVGKCSVPMCMNGLPAGFCDAPAFGKQIHGQRKYGRYVLGRWFDGYAPFLACPGHGGPAKVEEKE